MTRGVVSQKRKHSVAHLPRWFSLALTASRRPRISTLLVSSGVPRKLALLICAVRSMLRGDANQPPHHRTFDDDDDANTRNANEVALTGRSSRSGMVQALYDICNPSEDASLDMSQVGGFAEKCRHAGR